MTRNKPFRISCWSAHERTPLKNRGYSEHPLHRPAFRFNEHVVVPTVMTSRKTLKSGSTNRPETEPVPLLPIISSPPRRIYDSEVASISTILSPTNLCDVLRTVWLTTKSREQSSPEYEPALCRMSFSPLRLLTVSRWLSPSFSVLISNARSKKRRASSNLSYL